MMDLGLRCSYFSPSLEWTAEYWQVGKRRGEIGELLMREQRMRESTAGRMEPQYVEECVREGRALQSEERCRDASDKRSVVSEKAPVAIAFRRMASAGEQWVAGDGGWQKLEGRKKEE